MDLELFESGKKKLRIKKYPDRCGRGLYLITSIRKLKDHCARKGICVSSYFVKEEP